MEIDKLNKVQLEAVKYCDGPIIVIAGAGSGKTKVLTSKISYLLSKKNISPFNILTLTFTNKAAREMESRVEKLSGQESKNLFLGTFHSVFSKILRIESHMLGYTKGFTIYDREDSKSIIKSIVKEFGLDDKIYNSNLIISRISGAKNKLLTATEYYEDPICQADDHSAKRPLIGKIFLKYEDKCFKSNAMDFDDILLNTFKLFNQNPEILYKYQEQFKYILIDEFQDTNLLQYKIIKDLSKVHGNICVVGDDAQSIYAFRGANIYNMINFKKDFKNVQIFKLEQNYRSTKSIVNAANSVISYNVDQIPKKSWTANIEGEPIYVNQSNTDIEESKVVARSILDIRMRKYTSYNNFAILYRTNTQSRTIEEELRKSNIPYKVIGGLSFYQRKEVKDFVAYMKFVLNHNDEEALKRIINIPKRGIGPTSVNKIIIAADTNNISLWDVLCNIDNYVTGNVVLKIKDFVEMIKLFSIESKKYDAFTVANNIAKKSLMLQALLQEKSEVGSFRYENIQELLNGIKIFTANDEIQDKSLANFVEGISLLSSIDEEKGEESKVTLMTIHSSKGLEFDHVFIIGLEENLFPAQLMNNTKEDIEEERRLFYVALTRAKQSVHLSYALKRFRYGKQIESNPSRFLSEIDKKYIKNNTSQFSRSINSSEVFKKRFLNKTNTIKSANYSKKATENNLDFKAVDPSILKSGMKVKHIKFGIGIITKIDLSHGSKKAVVKFNHYGEKTLLLNFAKLALP